MNLFDHTDTPARMSNITYARQNATDDCYTPGNAVDPLIPFLSTFRHVWEPCAGDGHLARALMALNLSVTQSDIANGLEFDIRHATMPHDTDVVVTNPPFSLKREIVTRLLDMNVSFALLLPINTMCTLWYQPVADHIDIVPIYGRLRFVGHKSDAPFYCAWFTRHVR